MQYKLSASDHSSSDGSSNAGSGSSTFCYHTAAGFIPSCKALYFFFFSWGLKLCVGGIREGGVGRGGYFLLLSLFSTSAFIFFPGTHTAALWPFISHPPLLVNTHSTPFVPAPEKKVQKMSFENHGAAMGGGIIMMTKKVRSRNKRWSKSYLILDMCNRMLTQVVDSSYAKFNNWWFDHRE